MRHARIFVLAAAALGGCSANPCDGRGAACVNALVEGYSGALDQLRISIDQPTASTSTTPNPPSSFTLPVKVALVLPPGTAGHVSVGVDGLSSGAVVASAAPQSVTVPASGTITFTLAGGTGGGADLSMPPFDLAGIVSVAPPTFNFSVDRGASDVKTFHFGNGSDAPVTATASVSGDAAFTISNDGCAGASIDAGMGCDVTVTFAPTTSGMGKATTLTIGGATASVTGDANPAWSAESPAQASMTTFNALAVVSATQQLAGGTNPNALKIFENSGTSWSPFGLQPSGGDYVNGLAVGDGGTLLVAAPSGVLRGSGSTFTNELPTTQPMRALVDGDSFGTVAVGDVGIYRYVSGAWINDGPGHGDGGVVNVSAISSDGTNIYVTASNALYRGTPMAGVTPYTPVTVNAAMPLNGVWVPPGAGPSNVWVVAGDGSIWHIPSTFTFSDQPTRDTVPTGVSGLYGVSGLRAGSSTLLLAVGTGGVILRSTGDGSWTQDKSPTTAVLRAVRVTSMTEAYAVGDGGTILHYY